MEILLHGIIVANENISPNRFISRQRLRRRQRLESFINTSSTITIITTVLLTLPTIPSFLTTPNTMNSSVIVHRLLLTTTVQILERILPSRNTVIKVIEAFLRKDRALIVVESIGFVISKGELLHRAEARLPAGSGSEIVIDRCRLGGEVGFGPDGVAQGEVGESGGVETELVAEVEELPIGIHYWGLR